MNSVSKCCRAPVTVGGAGSTHYHVCSKCDEACDVVLDIVYERWRKLMADESMQLSPDEIEAGWHFCPEWDGLLIGSTMSEMDECVCAGINRSARFVRPST